MPRLYHFGFLVFINLISSPSIVTFSLLKFETIDSEVDPGVTIISVVLDRIVIKRPALVSKKVNVIGLIRNCPSILGIRIYSRLSSPVISSLNSSLLIVEVGGKTSIF